MFLGFAAALIAGLLVGTTLGLLGLANPAPATFAGVLAVCGSVLGMYLGYGHLGGSL